ncbi:MAG: hypothetical protein ACTSVO_01845 [Candidatus Heimdallarchaeaceae archaeon]
MLFWSRNVGKKVKNIRYTYARLAYFFIAFGVFVGLAFYSYSLWIEQTMEIWEIISVGTMFILIAVGIMSFVYFMRKLLVEEGSIEEMKIEERNQEKRMKLRVYYITPKRRKIILFIRVLMSLESSALFVASFLILNLL